jgi:hypothetical protein
MTTEEQRRRLVEIEARVWICMQTGNPCGTDMRPANHPCDCVGCDAHRCVTYLLAALATAPQGDAGEVARKIVNSCSTWGGLTNNAELIEAIAAALHQREQAARAEERRKCATAAAIHSCYPIETDWERGYDTGRKDAAAAIRNPGQVEK